MFHVLCIQKNCLAGAAQQLLCLNDMFRQGPQLQLFILVAGDISKTQPVPPFDQFCSHRCKTAHRLYSRISSPRNDAVA